MSRDAEEDPTGPPAVLPVEPGDRAPIGLRIQSRYRIVGELGGGPFGTVCLAEDEATGRWVAIRLLPHALAGALHAAQPVRRVGRSMVTASTAHPGLAHVLEFGEVEHGRPFVAMELVEGRRLSEILSEGKPLDVGAALRLALDLGGAVETLHNMGLVHGALRPRTMMVLADWRVKLMDLERRPPMQTILNLLWEVANSSATRWKRTAAIMGGAALAASIAGLGAWSLFAPRPSAPPPLAQPAPPLTARQAPVSATAPSSGPAVETPPAPEVVPATAAVERSAAAKTTPPSAPPLAAPPAKAGRREQLRPPQAPASAARERPASSNDAEGDDAGAVIDWLLNRSSTRGQ